MPLDLIIPTSPTPARPRATLPPPPLTLVEDGSAMINSNSYVDDTEADAWMSVVLWSDNWWNASPDDKTRALIYAARVMDHAFIWRGYKTTRGQAMMWPRIWCVDPDITIGYYPAISQPPNVIVGNTGGMIWPTYYPANYMPLDRLVACQVSLAFRMLGTYAQAAMTGNQPYQDPAVTDVSLGQGAVSIKMTPMQAQAAGTMGLIDDEVAAFMAPLGSRRYSNKGGIRKIRRGM